MLDFIEKILTAAGLLPKPRPIPVRVPAKPRQPGRPRA